MRICALFWFMGAAFAAAPDSVLTRYLDFGDTGQAKVLAADPSGNLFAVGLVTEPSGLGQIRVIKTDPNGNPLASIDFGGSLQDSVAGAATDAQGNIVIVGSTPSADFPLVGSLTPALNPQPRLPAAFVVKIDSQLKSVLFSALLGGTTGTFASGVAVAVDAQGNVYVAGATDENNFPITPNAFQSTIPNFGIGGSEYATITEISAQGQLVFSTFYSGTHPLCSPSENCEGNGVTIPSAILVDAGGNIFVAGNTTMDNLPTTAGAYAQQCTCSQAGFIAKFAPGGSTLAWATLVPPSAAGSSSLAIDGIAQAGDGSVVAAGYASGIAVTPGVIQAAPADAAEGSGFVARIDATGSKLLFSTYLGGGVLSAGAGGAQAVAVDSQGLIWTTGSSSTPTFPGIPSLGGTYTVALSLDGTQVSSGFTAPSDAVGQAIVVSSSGPASLGSTGSLLLGGAAQAASLLGMANSGAAYVSGIVAPLELISFYGIGLGPSTPLTAQVKNVGPGNQNVVTSSLGGFQVLFNGVAAPLLYVGAQQINAVVPLEVADGETATLQIVTPSGTIAGPTLRVRRTQPQVFGTLVAGSLSFASALNQDGTLNSAANPAPPGSVVTVWGTGAGLLSPSYADGAILGPGGPAYLFSAAGVSITQPVSVLSGQLSVQVEYAGAAPNAVEGVIQVNFVVSGTTYRLQIGSAVSSPFYIWVPGFSVSN